MKVPEELLAIYLYRETAMSLLCFIKGGAIGSEAWRKNFQSFVAALRRERPLVAEVIEEMWEEIKIGVNEENGNTH